MEQDEVPDHRIEGLVRERKSFNVALAKVELGVVPTGEREHPFDPVETDDSRPSFGGLGGRIARARSDIE